MKTPTIAQRPPNTLPKNVWKWNICDFLGSYLQKTSHIWVDIITHSSHCHQAPPEALRKSPCSVKLDVDGLVLVNHCPLLCKLCFTNVDKAGKAQNSYNWKKNYNFLPSNWKIYWWYGEAVLIPCMLDEGCISVIEVQQSVGTIYTLLIFSLP